MSLKSIIVDDELHCVDTLKWQINNYTDIHVLQVFTQPTLALDYVNNHPVDIVFLDIEMPELNGFEFLEKVNNKNFEIIFTTAYDEYALKAFKASAIDYLLKPISKEALRESLQKVTQKQQNNVFPKQLEILNNIFYHKNKERIAVPTKEGLSFLKIKEILYCISDGNYTEIYLENQQKIVVCKALKEIESLLIDVGFLRIHHSHVINLQKIKNYIRGDGGYVVMDDNKMLNVSRSKKELLLNCF